ncbi:hypothetical protein [Rahnella inusitata]|uniref:hypothetical protein n=1 Tax=Rahnella inusitata TaxID=58169 RepID=UPI001BC82CCC|nr:hypothetical protein [Rahnella inusitata]QUT13792.1 hypothetical protein I2123_13800 [Rahnella inusitata]
MENNELTEVKSSIPSLEGLPQEVIQYVHGLVAENVRMDKFVDECLQAAWEGGSLDGGEIQDIGLKHGLLREEVYSADQHESLVEDPSNFEDGDSVYFRTEMTNTEATMAEIGAKPMDVLAGVAETMLVKFSNAGVSHCPEAVGWRLVKRQAESEAANLRAGRKG